MKSLVLVLVAALALSSMANAQWQKDKNYAGVNVGLSGVGSTLTFGADYERDVYDLSGGAGSIGVGGLFNYWSYDFTALVGTSGFSYRYITLGVTGSYHLALPDKKWDPFAGLVIGYYIVNVKTPTGTFTFAFDSNRAFFGFQGGVRYFFSPNVAAQARVGFGAYILAVGVDFSF